MAYVRRVFTGPDLKLSVVTGSIWAKRFCFSQVWMHGLLFRWKPGMGKDSDAAVQISDDCHLLTVKKGDSIPPLLFSCDSGGEAGVEVSGYGECH